MMRGTKVTVMGLGRHGGGVGVSRWLAEQGCRVTVTDIEPADRLAPSLFQLADVSIERYTLGGHDENDFRKAQMVVVNPAVRPQHKLLKLARRRGVQITSEIELFLERCPAAIVGITGTTGKSTTCTMLAEILRHGGRCTWLGGNIGLSLLSELKWMHAGDVVVLELSSFQLAHLSDDARMPCVAVVTNCTANHLDWHGSWSDYVRAKQRLLANRVAKPLVILNPWDAEVATWRALPQEEFVSPVDDSWIPPLRTPGEHNRQNARLAATAAARLGVERQCVQTALASFTGLAHRLEIVAEVAQRRFINDSKSTSPAATLAALAAIDGPVWLIAGGVDRPTNWDELAKQIAARTRGVAAIGAARRTLASAIRKANSRRRCLACEHLGEAVAWTFELSKPGDTILLSPACTSFDQFTDFAQRGSVFAEMVQTLAATERQGSKTAG